MLATPKELEDFALGFSLTEGIVGSPRELYELEVIEHANGDEVRMRIPAERFIALRERRRAMAGRTG